MNYVDAHCHLADRRLEKELNQVIARSKKSGVSSWLQGGLNPVDWGRQKELRSRLGNSFYLCFGLHPWWVSQTADDELDQALEQLDREIGQAQALGELGLDQAERFQSLDIQQRQLRVFEAQLEKAHEWDKPLVLHVVRAHPLAIKTLNTYGPFGNGGIVHSFGAGENEAKAYLAMGFKISFGGMLTRPSANRLRAVASTIPDDGYVLETDSPDQTVHGVQGLGEPSHLIQVAEEMGKCRGLTSAQVLEQARANFESVFTT